MYRILSFYLIVLIYGTDGISNILCDKYYEILWKFMCCVYNILGKYLYKMVTKITIES